MALASGSRLGPYEIVAPLGAGGMGEVYRAKDPRLGREVAIKVLPAEVASDPERLRRFEQEAKAVSALNHPNILTVFDLGDQEGTPFLVLELLEGASLREALRNGALPARRAIEIGAQIARGLAAAHGRGIVHRDLKPENIFLTRDGVAKILDFGLAKQIRSELSGADIADASTRLETSAGIVLGTVGYMAPEQVRGERADARSDLFAFGALLYELLTGQRAFRGATTVEILNAILKEEPPPLAETNPAPPAAAQRVVERCLAKDPAHRFQSATDLAFALEAVSLVSGRTAALAVSPDQPARPRRARWLLGAIVLAVVAGAGWLAGRGAPRARHDETTLQQLTFGQQSIFNARFAPDGKTLLFSAALRSNVPAIFAISPQFPEPRSLGLDDTHLLAVSSRGELAVLTHARYIVHNLFGGTLARVPLEGRAPRELLANVREADWTPDGSALAILHNVGGKDRLEYPIGKVLVETGGYLSDLRFSPRGDRIAFCEHPERWDNRGSVAVVDLEGRKRTLAEGFSAMQGLAWSPQGDEIYFSAEEASAPMRVLAVTPDGTRRVAVEGAGYLAVHDAAAGGRLAVVRDDSSWRLMARPAGSVSERDLTWLDSSHFPDLSADGKSIVFSEMNSRVGTNYAACLRGTDGSPVVQLGEGGWTVFSPDAHWVLSLVPSAPMTAVLYPTGAGQAHHLKRGRIESYDSARFFPDGRSVLLCGREAESTDRCFRQEIPDGEPQPLTPEGTRRGIPSPDGRRILLIGPDGPEIFSLDSGQASRVPGSSRTDEPIGWSRDGKLVLLSAYREVPRRIERLELASGRRELLMQVGPADLTGVLYVGNFVLAADELSYAYVYARQLSYLFVAQEAP